MKSEMQGASRALGKRIVVTVFAAAIVVGIAYFALGHVIMMRAQHAAVEIVALSLYEHCTPAGHPGPQGQCAVDPATVRNILAARTCPVGFYKNLPIRVVPYEKKMRVSCGATTVDI